MANESKNEPNVYTLLDSYTDRSIDTAVPFFLKANKFDKIIRYPDSLGKAQGGIPFTLFMPYKRPADRGLGNFRSKLGGNALYQELPTPDFAIALPTPPSALKVAYQSNYDSVDLGQAAGILSTTFNMDKDFDELQSTAAAAAEFTKNNIGAAGIGAGAAVGFAALVKFMKTRGLLRLSTAAISAAAGGATGLLAKTAAGEGLTEQAKVALMQQGLSTIGATEGAGNIFFGKSNNPFTDRLFKNVEFREHNFNYTFLPKNQTDSEHIDEIIQLFKYAMLPRPSSDVSGFFEFPYEFQITHSIQATTFTLLPSVLESLETDFGGGTDSLKLFKTTSGGKQYPTKITVSMKFREMVLLNRDRITSFKLKDGNHYFNSDSAALSDTTVKRYRF